MQFLKDWYHRKKLRKCTKDMPLFSFDGMKVLAKIVSVYDGDTCTIAFIYRGKPISYKVRMDGYDSPEMRPLKKNSVPESERQSEKQAALAAKAYIESIFQKTNNWVYISLGKFGKYGRVLGTFYSHRSDTESINKMMIKEGHGLSYHGGKKTAYHS